MSIKIAVLTLVKGRKDALLNLINGLSINASKEIELIVVHMNEDTYDLPTAPFPIYSISFNSEEDLPLAKARNLAISKTKAHHCIFLDVDCIPAANFIQAYADAFKKGNKLWSGQIRYLSKGFPPELKSSELEEWSKPDPIRGQLETIPYELFWSLNFGCSQSLFQKIGGFDESYTGYGAEDTDFSFMARAQSVELAAVNAIAYHQPHASYSPPLNHLEDIVNNAKVFYHKWQCWPMEGWLKQFAELGYISWNSNELEVISYPDPSVIDNYLK